MLLRRFFEHFRKQPWTAIGIEFLIVVLGVFVASQVTDWSAAQADRRLGRDYTARLIADLEQDLENRRSMVVLYDTIFESAERTLELLEQTEPDPRALVVHAYRASQIVYRPPTRATWDTVVSAGDIGLLPERAVAGGLARYFSQDSGRDARDEMILSPYRQRVRSIIPHRVQEAIRARCAETRNEAQQIVGFRDDCDLELDAAEIRLAAQRLMRDPAVRDDLAYQLTSINAARTNIRGEAFHLERAIAALREPARE